MPVLLSVGAGFVFVKNRILCDVLKLKYAGFNTYILVRNVHVSSQFLLASKLVVLADIKLLMVMLNLYLGK